MSYIALFCLGGTFKKFKKGWSSSKKGTGSESRKLILVASDMTWGICLKLAEGFRRFVVCLLTSTSTVFFDFSLPFWHP